MEHQNPRNPAPAATAADASPPPTDVAPALDAHGHDPSDYDWIPVRRKPRVDGWSPEKQRLFIATLADTGSVTQSARAVGMAVRSARALRRAPDGDGFDRAWTVAIRHAMARLIDVCMERALEGSEEPVFDRDGRVIAHRVKHHDRLAMFLLRAHMPELFRDAKGPGRVEGEAPPLAPVAAALTWLDPVPPAAPHAAMDADALTDALELADICDGKLPHWRRDPDLVALEREAKEAANPAPEAPPMGEQFERDLEAAKTGAWQPPKPRPGKRAQRRRRV